jgi:hypothetical protein
MDNLITVSDFKAPYKIIANDEAVQQRVSEVIAFAQSDFLQRILGRLEYDKLEASPSNAEWVSFISGKNYTAGGVDYKYAGIKAPLAMYAFKFIQDEFLSDPVPLGYISREFKNGKYAYPANRVIESWNRMVNLTFGYNYRDGYYPTVERFLLDNETDYPDLVIRQIDYMHKI